MKEYHKTYDKMYYAANKEKENKYNKTYRITNKEKIKKRQKIYRITHKEEIKRWHTERRRNLGFIPLNKNFDGADGHHIDKQHVIYIPKELHMSVIHNQNNKESMEKINELTLNWMLGA